jgi:hypothetical protein
MELAPLPTFKRTDYGPKAPRVADKRRTYPHRRGWGSGWPNCQRNLIHQYDANRINVRVRDEIAPLIVYLIKASNALGYDIRRTAEPDGGVGSFACRAIKNSDPQRPSFHSWGLAIDQNTKSNPMRKTFRSTTPPEVVNLWESAGFFWGGRYPVPPWYYDAMPFEYLFRPQDVARDLDNAQNAFLRLSGSDELYAQLQKDDEGNLPSMVRVLQFRLNQHGATLEEDGDFGAATDKAVRAFQKDKGLVVDGIVGPITWGELNDDPEAADEDEPEEDE